MPTVTPPSLSGSGVPEAPLMDATKHGRMDAAWHPLVRYRTSPPGSATIRRVVVSGNLFHNGTPILTTLTPAPPLIEDAESSNTYSFEDWAVIPDGVGSWSIYNPVHGAQWFGTGATPDVAVWVAPPPSSGTPAVTFISPVSERVTGNIVVETGEHPPYLWLNHSTDAAPVWRRTGASLEGGNGADVRPGRVTTLNPYGLGYEIVCSAAYIDLFLNGEHYALQQDGVTIRGVFHCLTEPTNLMDADHGYVVGSRRTHDDGRVWVCTDAAIGGAVWALQSSAASIVFKTTNFTAEAGKDYFTEGAGIEITLPAIAEAGDVFSVTVQTGFFEVLTVETITQGNLKSSYIYNGAAWIPFVPIVNTANYAFNSGVAVALYNADEGSDFYSESGQWISNMSISAPAFAGDGSGMTGVVAATSSYATLAGGLTGNDQNFTEIPGGWSLGQGVLTGAIQNTTAYSTATGDQEAVFGNTNGLYFDGYGYAYRAVEALSATGLINYSADFPWPLSGEPLRFEFDYNKWSSNGRISAPIFEGSIVGNGDGLEGYAPSFAVGQADGAGYADNAGAAGAQSSSVFYNTEGGAAVAGLPPAADAPYARAVVYNALAPVFGAIVAGGGAVVVPVYSDGTNWRVG